MFDVTRFLVRWLFLSNLIRDAAEIQTLPYQPNYGPSPHPPTSQVSSSVPQQQQHHQQHNSLSTANTGGSYEDEWRDQCLRGIVSYPPGTQRLLIMDAMRAELVERLCLSLQEADQTLRDYEMYRRRESEGIAQEGEQFVPNSPYPTSVSVGPQGENDRTEDDIEVDDPYLDADVEILKAFERETQFSTQASVDDDAADTTLDESKQAVLVISRNGTSMESVTDSLSGIIPSSDDPVLLVPDELGDEKRQQKPTAEAVDDAQRTIRTVRDYLPQLVAVVLKSPPAFDANLVNPIDKLRKVIVKRCVDDANWGVDMCWLLEAEVGRAWKTLFEHRQQTGRRLIIVLPAEKAAVLAKIGTEKREAFDLLQDAEQATAFGYTAPLDELLVSGQRYGHQHQFQQPQSPYQHSDCGYALSSSRLPSSLSLRRCSHFGDTMHFIDRLTKISLDLRHAPVVHRESYLKQGLNEMNRRLRRRMVTRGDVSLDVEDHRGPFDWPQVSDITADMLRFSVHLPLDPKQQKSWPGGAPALEMTTGGATRVLNIVVDECRILASRERCPYLIHVEVAETGLRGNDPRLYASGAPGLGATIEEALAMSGSTTSGAVSKGSNSQVHAPYHIPSELLDTSIPRKTKKSYNLTISRYDDFQNDATTEMPRGGWQANETAFYTNNPDDVFVSNPYDTVRENEFQELHEQMYSEHSLTVQHPEVSEQRRFHSTREALLDRVFGQPWNEKCEEIRQSSPYGKVHGWRLASFIVKAGEDIRREALVMQIINKLSEWFKTDIPESHRPHMRPYTIMCVGGEAGLVECLSDAKSVDEVKKKTDGFQSLRDYFERAYGPPTTHSSHHHGSGGSSMHPKRKEAPTFEQAQDNFLRSLVGYSLVCYILQIKDRHSANILMDREGNIMHIDFGFVLGDTPKMAKVPIFSERAPFKLSQEFWDVLGGWNINQGGLGVRFCHMFEYAFACAASHTEEIVSLVEATMLTLTQSPRQARILATGVRNRLRMRGAPGSNEQKTFIMELINAALIDFGTSAYDWLQRNMNGYQ